MAEIDSSAEVIQIDRDQTEEAQLDQLDLGLNEGKEIVVPERSETDELEEPTAEAVETREAEPEADPEPETDTSGVNYDLEIPLPDHSEPVRLGDLKDRFVEYQRRETDMQRREAELSNEYGKLAQVQAEMQAAGGPMSPEQRQQVQMLQAQRIQREAELMLETIPDWKDQAAFQRDRQEIIEMMAPYGMTEQHISSVTDHNFALFLKHHLDMKRRIAKAEQVKAEPAKPVKRPKGQRPAATGKKTQTDKLVQAAVASKHENVKMAAIDALLGE